MSCTLAPRIWIALAVCSALCLFGATVGSDQQLVTRVVLPAMSAVVGERLTTDLVLEDVPGAEAMLFHIVFDPTLVAPDPDIRLGAFGQTQQSLLGANIVPPDTLKITVAATGEYVGSGVLVEIDWDLLAAGNSPLEIALAELETSQGPSPLPVDRQDGWIDVQPVPVEARTWGGIKDRYARP